MVSSYYNGQASTMRKYTLNVMCALTGTSIWTRVVLGIMLGLAGQ